MGRILKDVSPIFDHIPRRRDRRQHNGLLSYARISPSGVMPRAITFTAAFYSLGIPPEFIGLGRCLSLLNKEELILLKEIYPSLIEDITKTGGYLNKDNLERFCASSNH